MASILKFIISLADTINENVGKAISWVTLILVALVCFDVLMRRFDLSRPWMMEMEWHLYALIFLFGAAYAFKHDRHVRVDLFYANFSARDKAWINLIGGVLFLIPWCIVIIITSYYFALDAYNLGERSATPGGLANRFLLKFAITVGISLLLLQALASVARSILVLTNNEPTIEEENS